VSADTPQSVPPRPRRRRTRLYLSLAASAAMLGALALPVPYVVLSPGPVFNTLGEVGGQEILEISGTTTYPTTGTLDMTTVRERGGPYGPLTMVEAVAAAVNDRSRVVPAELLFQPGVTGEQSREQGRAEFTAAQSNAVAAALGSLDIPVTQDALVAQVDLDGPSAEILKIGDLIVEINGVAVSGPDQVVEAVRTSAPDTQMVLTVRRGGETLPITATLGANPDNPQQGRLGIVLRSVYQAPFDIEFSLGGIGGPSAGMMFALAIVDELTPGDLTAGVPIAGTGTIDPQGNVGAIGGVEQKMYGARAAGAELFLAPQSNCDAIIGSVPAGLTVAAVRTLAEAEQAITDFAAGRSPVSCPLPDELPEGSQAAAG